MISSRKLINKAEEEELVLEVTADVHGDAVTGTSTESSILDILVAWLTLSPPTLSNFLIIDSKTFLDHKLLIEPCDTAGRAGAGDHIAAEKKIGVVSEVRVC